jgi:hypothetical protein
MLAHVRANFQRGERQPECRLLDKSSCVAVSAQPTRLACERREFTFQIEVERSCYQAAGGALLSAACFANRFGRDAVQLEAILVAPRWRCAWGCMG